MESLQVLRLERMSYLLRTVLSQHKVQRIALVQTSLSF
jgi:hypothetical protein